jgi:RND superfamily putative drug exporter
VAIGVLLDTIIVRSVLVTALNLDIGRHVWWPGQLWRTDGPEHVADEAHPAEPVAAGGEPVHRA